MTAHDVFNEDTLRAEIIKVWGEYGAHIDVYDHVLTKARATTAETALAAARSQLAEIERAHRSWRGNAVGNARVRETVARNLLDVPDQPTPITDEPTEDNR